LKQEFAPPKKITEIKDSKELFERIRLLGLFKLKMTGLLTLHNHVCYAREKKDAHSLLVFDVADSLSDRAAT
jgi:hypothetical protein